MSELIAETITEDQISGLAGDAKRAQDIAQIIRRPHRREASIAMRCFVVPAPGVGTTTVLSTHRDPRLAYRAVDAQDDPGAPPTRQGRPGRWRNVAAILRAAGHLSDRASGRQGQLPDGGAGTSGTAERAAHR